MSEHHSALSPGLQHDYFFHIPPLDSINLGILFLPGVFTKFLETSSFTL